MLELRDDTIDPEIIPVLVFKESPLGKVGEMLQRVGVPLVIVGETERLAPEMTPTNDGKVKPGVKSVFETFAGALTAVVVPLPSCPKVLSPQHKGKPLLKTQEFTAPAAMLEIPPLPKPYTVVGIELEIVKLLPSCP